MSRPQPPWHSLDFDELSTWHRVPHTRLSQQVDVFHDDEGGLLQGDNAQVVVIRLTVREGLVPESHHGPWAQGLVLPLAHLHHKHRDTPVLPCASDFRKGESFPSEGMGAEIHLP